jgi:Dyp-type peroxidase family
MEKAITGQGAHTPPLDSLNQTTNNKNQKENTMAINLSQPLRWTSATPEETEMLKDLQGNILKGHGRPRTANLFLKFDPAKAEEARQFVRAIAGLVTDAHMQLQDARIFKETGSSAPPFIAFFLSAAGYRALGVPEARTPGNAAFRAGLKSRQLNDPPVNTWDQTFREEIHAMILIGDTTLDGVKRKTEEIRKLLPSSVKLLGQETGIAYKNKLGDGMEHFGYVDGRSQPLMLVEDIENERDEMGGTSLWDPAFGLDQALVPDPGGAAPTSFGSYFVFRKLEQNVKGFKEREEALANKLGLAGEDREIAGAMVIGRFEDGTPVVMRREEEGFHPVWNNFNFDKDKEGLRCPFQGHIRKTNPRGDSTALGATIQQERSHLMARRGITYGAREIKDGEFIGFPTGGVGLLFMAYQVSLEGQFEFTQRAWANNLNFVRPETGIDPVIGQGAPTKQHWPVEWGQPHKDEFNFSGFVTMKGGEYFFAPSISFLKNPPK